MSTLHALRTQAEHMPYWGKAAATLTPGAATWHRMAEDARRLIAPVFGDDDLPLGLQVNAMAAQGLGYAEQLRFTRPRQLCAGREGHTTATLVGAGLHQAGEAS